MMYEPKEYVYRKHWIDKTMDFFRRNTIEIAGIAFAVCVLAWAVFK